MKRTILSAAAICAIAVGFALPSTSFAATQMANNGEPGQPSWYQSNVGNDNNGAGSVLGGTLDFDRNCSLIPITVIGIAGNSCHMDQNYGPWTGDRYNYQPGQR